MSYDDYVDHISRKYKLAVACAIVKSKPNELETVEYIKILQEKHSKNNNFDDISIKSDDFQFDMNELDYENHNPTNMKAVDNESNESPNVDDDVSEKLPTNQKLVESVISRIEQTDGPKNTKFIPESQVIDDDFTQIDIETEIQEQNTVENMNLVKNKDLVSTYCDIAQAGETHKAIDSQATELYSLEDSHISQSQDIGFSILDQFVLGVRKGKPKDIVAKNELSKKVCNQISFTNENAQKNDENITKTELSKKVCRNISEINCKSAQNIVKKAETTKNIGKPEQSKKICKNDLEQSTEKSNKNNETDKNTECKDKISESNAENSNILNEKLKSTVTLAKNDFSVNKNELKVLKSLQNGNNIDKPKNIHTNKEIDFTTTQEIDTELHEEIQNIITTQQVYNTEDFNFSSEDEQTDRQTQSHEMDDIFDSQNDTVPFKIVEELQRVKHYLKMGKRMSNDGYSSDTGYQSGSQWSVKSSAQVSEKWLNQAAHTLVGYLTNSPITTTTLDICNDISQVLGELVDKLHSDENYPQFMETILDNVNVYLDQIYEDDEEDMEQKKDVIIHRLVYLCQSVHIISYILEKMTLKLEKIYTELISNENIYEISKIDETKNISYIFHILEILLQRYIRKKDSIYGKKSYIQKKKVSISDIWRKKWDPERNKEQEIMEEEKQCILTKTSEVLNKIIVNCMEMYSLISFAALQCYNIIQK